VDKNHFIICVEEAVGNVYNIGIQAHKKTVDKDVKKRG
jgi:hypothetical protein